MYILKFFKDNSLVHQLLNKKTLISYIMFFYTTHCITQCVPLATEPGIEDIATKFEQEYVRCVRYEEECVWSVCL
jgi:hypothetical protein